MPIAIPSGLLKDQAQVFINALKRPGVELGEELSLLSAIARGGGQVEFVGGGEYAERMVFEHDSGVIAQHFNPNDVAPAASAESVKEANIPWAKARAVIKVLHHDNARSGDSNLQSNQSLWQHRLENAAKELFSLLETTAQSGAGSTDDDGKGLPFWVSTTSNIGGIAMASNSWLQSVRENGSSNALSKALLRRVRNTLFDAQGVQPGRFAIVCSATQRSKYQELFDTLLRAEMRKLGDLQLETVSFEGVPFLEIPGFPNDKVYFLHLPDWKIKVLLQPINETTERNPRLAGMSYNGYPFAISELGRQGDWTAAQCVVYYQILCQAPWRQGEIHSLGTSLA